MTADRTTSIDADAPPPPAAAPAPRRLVVAAVVAVVVGVVAQLGVTGAAASGAIAGASAAVAAVSAPPSGADGSEPVSTPMITSDFYPENANISDCVSALPRPECGSRERGGWRQTAVLVTIVAGLGLIAWRLSVTLRRRPGADD